MHGYSSLLGGIGLVAFVFGLISVLLLILGAPTDLTWIFANFVIGVVLLAAWGANNLAALRERMGSSEARRVGTYGTSAVLSTVLTIVILGMLGFLATRYHARFDWSEAGVHSLSDQTKKVLGGLERGVDVVAFYPPLEAQPVRELLDRYTYASDGFDVQIVDPTARPDLVEKFGYTRDKLEGGLVRVSLGEEAVEISDEVTEQAVTNAIVKLTRTQQKKVYFLTGHNERPVQGDGAGDASGFQLAAEALLNENYRFEELLLGATGAVPEDADVVVVAGATRPLQPGEHEALKSYMEGGGALLVLVDPRAKTDLYDDLESWGVQVGEDVVIDYSMALFGRAATPFARQYADHPITADLREATLFHLARSVQSSGAEGSTFIEIVKTGEESWGEHDLQRFFSDGEAEFGDGDLDGPVPIGVAGTVTLDVQLASYEGEEPPEGEGDTEAEARVVVYGDSDFASNQFIDAYRNRDLFVNSVNWLLGDVEAISIRPSRSRASRLELSNEELSQIRYLALFVLPEAIAVLGVFAWWSRRRAPGR